MEIFTFTLFPAFSSVNSALIFEASRARLSLTPVRAFVYKGVNTAPLTFTVSTVVVPSNIFSPMVTPLAVTGHFKTVRVAGA